VVSTTPRGGTIHLSGKQELELSPQAPVPGTIWFDRIPVGLQGRVHLLVAEGEDPSEAAADRYGPWLLPIGSFPVGGDDR